MSRAVTLVDQNPDTTALFELTQPSEATTVASLREAVDTFVRRYLDEMEGETGTDFYPLVLAEVEAPMLQAVMEYTRHNQSRAAQMLGLPLSVVERDIRGPRDQ